MDTETETTETEAASVWLVRLAETGTEPGPAAMSMHASLQGACTAADDLLQEMDDASDNEDGIGWMAGEDGHAEWHGGNPVEGSVWTSEDDPGSIVVWVERWAVQP